MKTLENDFKGTYRDLIIKPAKQGDYNGWVCEITDTENGILHEIWGETPEQADANAKLFCASKEMVKVLETIYNSRKKMIEADSAIEGTNVSLVLQNDPILKAIEQVLDKAL